MALPADDYGGTPVSGGGGYPPPAHTIAGTYYDANWNEVNADGSPKTGSTGVTYRQVVDTDGSLSGVPGATVQVSSTGSVSIISRPSTSGSGGGGGAASQAGRYSTQVDTTGAITGIPGAVYQQDSVDGSITIVSRPSATNGSFANPLDKNNDGLNDSTGWANGVFKDSSSPSGFYYASGGRYIPVTPDGAPYNGPDLSGGGANAKTWTGQGPKGYGTYYLDGAGGTPGTFIGDTRAPSASSAAVSGSRASGGSSGGSSGSSAGLSAQINAVASAASDAARAAQQAAHDAWQGNQNDADRNWKAAQNAIDRALKLASDRAQFELTRTGLVQQQTKDQLAAAKQVADLISSTDPIKYRAFLAVGGGDIWNSLIGGGTAVSNEANLGAARTLRAMDNPTHIPTWDEIMAQGGFDVTNPPTLGANGVPVGGGTTTSAGGIGNSGPQIGYGYDTQNTNTDGTTGTGGTTGGTATPVVDNSLILGQIDPATGRMLDPNDPRVFNPAANFHPTNVPNYGTKLIGTRASGAWEIDPVTGQSTYNPDIGEQVPFMQRGDQNPEYRNFDLGAQAGVPLTVQQRNDFANAAYQNYTTDAYAGPNHQINNASYTPYVTQGQYTAIVGSPPPPRPPETFTDRFGNLQPAPAAMPYGNDQINHVIPTQAAVPTVSRFARGGVMVGGAMAVTGDSHNGRPNEEMVVNLNPDPRDRIAVVPLSRVRQMGMGPAIRSVIARGGMQVGGAQMPRAADGGIFGADSYLNPITPEDQPYLDRIQAIRDATDFSAWNPFRSDYFQADPTIRDANEKAVQAARGIPQASLVSYAQRYALPGIGRGALRIGV